MEECDAIFFAAVTRIDGLLVLAEFASCDVKQHEATIEKSLRKIPPKDHKWRYVYNNVQYNFHVESGFVFLCLSLSSIGGKVPFTFLAEIRNDFFRRFDVQTQKSAGAGDLDEEMAPVFQRFMNYYSANATATDVRSSDPPHSPRSPAISERSQSDRQSTASERDVNDRSDNIISHSRSSSKSSLDDPRSPTSVKAVSSSGGVSSPSSSYASSVVPSPSPRVSNLLSPAKQSRRFQNLSLSSTSTSTSTTSSAAIPDGMVEQVYKIIVVGDGGCGKTSLIRRYVHDVWSLNYIATVGVAFELKTLQYDESTIVKLQYWDISGQDRFRTMTRVYYKQAVAAIVVFDVTRPDTLNSIEEWKADIDEKVNLHDGQPVPSILLANKIDLVEDGGVAGTSHPHVENMKNEHGFEELFYTSAKTGVGVDEAMEYLISRLVSTKQTLRPVEMQFDDQEKAPRNSRGCCS